MGVICYHGIDPDWESPLAVRPEELEHQLRDLARRRSVVPIGQEGGPRRHVITFDDGFVSVYHHALPLLRELRLPSTMFVVADTLLDEVHRVDWVRPPDSVTPLTMSLDQLLEMREAGMTIASHSWAHRELPLLTEEECYEDLKSSRELLSDVFGERVRYLAYPFGLHSAHVRRAAERAGYDLAYSLPEGPEPTGPFAVPRAGIYRGNSPFAWRLKSSPLWLRLRLSPVYRGRAVIES